MTDQLDVWLAGHHAGHITRDSHQRVFFAYDPEYRTAPGMPPLSCSLPLTATTHAPDLVEPWLDNLLPDSDAVRARWAARLGLTRPTVFDLLTLVGEDCAGAVQFLASDQSPSAEADRIPVTEDQIADQIRHLRGDSPDWLFPDPSGRWSLGGAQPKFALGWDGDTSWYLPTGREPSTHIIKVGFSGQADSDWAEHITTRLAAKLGLTTAYTEMVRFGDQRATVVGRFDRLRDGQDRVVRLHQEDLCQALGLTRHIKYESAGGPGLAALASLLGRIVDRADVDSTRAEFARAIIFNWVAACPDAHAKNYAILHLGPRVRLAPLFDLTSASLLWPPTQVEFSGRLAMALGGEAQLFAIRRRHLIRAAADLGVDPEWFMTEAHRQVDAIVPALDETLTEFGPFLPSTLKHRFQTGLTTRVSTITRDLD
jgi:serine/threonine-protein kinase HipA